MTITGTWRHLAFLVLYLLNDAFLDPPLSSASLPALAVLEYLILLVVSRRSEWLVLAEGTVLGAADYAAMLLGTTGAGIMLLELAGGAALLLSSALNRPLLARYARRIPLLPVEDGLLGRANLLFGLLLLSHGTVMLAMTLTAGVRASVAVGAFLLLYLAVVAALRSGTRRDAVRNMPRLREMEGGGLLLLRGDDRLARLSTAGQRIVTVSGLELLQGTSSKEVLRPLEVALATAGARTIRLQDWPGDDLELEISGYHSIDGVRQKVLPIRPERRRGK